MSKYVVPVKSWLAPDSLSEFLPLITRNAQPSLQDEAGCERFDLLVLVKGNSQVVLYDGAVGPKVQNKIVTELSFLPVPEV